MKIVSSKQMSMIESKAYKNGSSESDFMEEAGSGVALVVQDYVERHDLQRQVILICGKGNNAGDAYVAGLHLLSMEYDVICWQLFPMDECSLLCRENSARFMHGGGRIQYVLSAKELQFPDNGIIVDGIFGTGFHGAVQGYIADVIEQMNLSGLPIIAIDIPSGLNGSTGEVASVSVVATQTAFLGLPKTGFFLRDGWIHVGKLRYVDFGLPKSFVEKSDATYIMLSHDLLKPLMPSIKRNRHKYEAGYVVALAGSPGMAGASLLSSFSALCGGAGIVRLLHPEGMEHELATGPYELIKKSYTYKNPHEVVELLNLASATLIGPGLGRTPQVKQLLKNVIPYLNKPCVIDADALTLLAEGTFVAPKGAVLTPHMGELKRLMKITDPVVIDDIFLAKCQEYAQMHQIILVLKGGPTYLFSAGNPVHVCPRGDPGMATAGSGDVLTGLIAALLAQGLAPFDAASLGVYLHGVAGEYASEELTPYCMTASDIINYFPDAFMMQERL